MNNNVKKMVKNVIEENAVDFKKTTSKALYEKIGQRLKQEYIAVSQNLLKKSKWRFIFIDRSLKYWDSCFYLQIKALQRSPQN